jgi:Dyp-type peroxidase family
MGAQDIGQQQAAQHSRLRSSTEIQGNILAPFNKPNQLFMFVNFQHNQARARDWLGRLIKDKRFATTDRVTNYNDKYRKAKADLGEHPVKADPQLAKTWIGVGLTSWGLVALHPELAPDLMAYRTFWEGPLAEGTDKEGNRTSPAAMLGDPGRSDPKHWVIGGPAQPPVDALVTLAGDNKDALKDEAEEERRIAEDEFGLHVLRVPQLDRTTPAWQLGGTLEREGISGIEHFGFKDGVSQPSIRDFTSPTTYNGLRWESEHRPGSPVIATGEFVLGYPGERGSYLRGPRPDPPEWMWHGSFQLFLRLTQDVAGWLEEMERLGKELGEEDIAAKVIGRHKDGRPLAPRGGGDKPNDFDYDDDPTGEHTPRWAHIRRLNPRHDKVYNDRSHRLLRRGIPFGPLAATPEEARADPKIERGLLLNAFMADLDDQFVVVQRHWASNSESLPVTPGPGRGGPQSAVTDGPDPLIGSNLQPCLLRRQGKDPALLDLRRFVHTSGAVFAFAPSMMTLGRLAGDRLMRER